MTQMQPVTQDIYNILLSNYIGYDRLYSMTIPTLYGDRQDTDTINLFIDLNSFLKRVWDARPYSFRESNVLAASVINACAHYRNYFWTRHMIKTNIYLVWGYNTPEYQPVEYNAHFRERVATLSEVQSLIDENIAALEFLCPYLPQIYFIDCNMHEVSAMIYTLVSDSTIPNIILTKDVYAYQLVAYCPNTFIYRPKKKHVDGTGIVDNSWVVMKSNLFRAMKHEMDYKATVDKPTNVRHLQYVLALSGMRARHVRGIMTFNRACATVASMEEDRPECFQDMSTFEYTLLFDTPNRCKGIGFKENGDLIARDNMLNVVHAADILRNSPAFINMKKGIQDLYNPQAVNEINNKEFYFYPLELMEL